MNKNILIIFLFLLFTSCITEKAENKYQIEKNELKYARGFSIKTNDNGERIITVVNPWLNSKNESFKYTLSKGKNDNNLLIPFKRIICLSTTHIGYLQALNSVWRIVGISGSDFICNDSLLTFIKEGKTLDVGYQQSFNFEKMMSLNPDIVLIYGVDASVIQFYNKLRSLNIPSIIISEYLEETPLAKTEWIKLFGELVCKRREADSIFSKVEAEYLRIKKRSSSLKNNPKVLCGLPWRANWYLPGAKSFMATYIKDAGGDYLWSDNMHREAFPLNLESILAKAVNADVWINCGDANSLKYILETVDFSSEIEAYKMNNVFNNNALLNKNGGNPYWEKGIMEPHIILNDLSIIFHHEERKFSEMVYYKKLY